ncbi:MAG: hypothetical protein HKN48_01550 [Flavobacteriaceae bacterium]|nr:hypothetical protein [Flavobacteriaceae bacterium]
MKKYAVLAFAMIMMSCQKEELTVVETQEETTISTDAQLLSLVQSVASHDGSFDDVVDGASCFSIDFPYICQVNGEQYTVTSPTDLEDYTMYDELIPVFPVSITFADHTQMKVASYEQLMALSVECADGDLWNDRITCIDFEYPVTLSLFNTDNSDFQTLVFNHDRDTFVGIRDIETQIIATLNYPITVQLENGERITITSNETLKAEILNIIPVCE